MCSPWSCILAPARDRRRCSRPCRISREPQHQLSQASVTKRTASLRAPRRLADGSPLSPFRRAQIAPAALATSATAAAGVRGVRTLTFGDDKETVWERSDFPKDKIKAILGSDTLAVLGYGPQGRGQALNARNNGVKVIIGLRQGGSSYDAAIKDG